MTFAQFVVWGQVLWASRHHYQDLPPCKCPVETTESNMSDPGPRWSSHPVGGCDGMVTCTARDCRARVLLQSNPLALASRTRPKEQ